MAFGIRLFKKKLTAERAADLYMQNIFKVFEQTKERDYERINDVCRPFNGKDIGNNDPGIIRQELMLALIALEFLFIKSMRPNKYDSLTEAVYGWMQSSLDNEMGTYALNVIKNEYIPDIEHVLREHLPPFDGVLFQLFYKLGIEFNATAADRVTDILGSKFGGWKAILDEYRIM